MIRIRLATFVTGVAASLTTIAALAQQAPIVTPIITPVAPSEAAIERPPMDLTYLELLSKEFIHRELAMTAQQIAEARKAYDDSADAGKAAVDKAIDASMSKREQPDFDKLNDIGMKNMEEHAKKAWIEVKKGLEPKQRERLQQLDYQMRGPSAFLDEGVPNPLSISAEQKKKLADCEQQLGKKAQEAMHAVTKILQDPKTPENFNPDREMESRLGKILDDFQAESLAVLSDQQRTDWEKLVGPKFDFPRGNSGPGEPPAGRP